jgi:hypothetical protein
VSEETSSRCDVEFAFLKMGWELLKLLEGKEKSFGKLLKRSQTKFEEMFLPTDSYSSVDLMNFW